MIGYYAHHHGVGHMTRSASIGARLDEPVTLLSSATPPGGHPAARWVELPLDVPATSENATAEDSAIAEDSVADPTAHGTLHWAPHDVAGLTARMAAIADWVARERPSVVVVDVSVEVTAFLRLLGVRVVVMAMPGERIDDPHRLGYRMADRIIAPWSHDVYRPRYLHEFAATTTYVGSISRFEGRDRDARATARAAPSVLVLGGAGGSVTGPASVEAAAVACPEFTWRYAGAGAGTWVDDVWPLLCSADVVITHAGQNAIADVAAARTPAVVIPQERPFDEQVATATALHDGGVAIMLPAWPEDASWSDVLCRARALDPAGWDRAHVDGAAGRAAAVVAEVAGS